MTKKILKIVLYIAIISGALIYFTTVSDNPLFGTDRLIYRAVRMIIRTFV